MVSDYVMTEHDCRATRRTPASVGMGSYNMDSHNCMRYVTADGHVQNEGDVQVSPGGPYQISYLSIVPAKDQVANLLAPVCVSSSHIAYGSIRMEPVFMILGQSAATAACLSIDRRTTAQSLPYEVLRERLLADGQVLEYRGPRRRANVGIDPRKLPGVVVDDRAAKKTGVWLPSSSVPGFVGASYLHDGNEGKGQCTIRFSAKLARGGNYEVRLAYTANRNRASNVPVRIQTQSGAVERTVNQKREPPIGKTWVSLGRHEFAKGAAVVEISNKGTNGYVIADAVQWLSVEDSKKR